jgi:hypothetical protein
MGKYFRLWLFAMSVSYMITGYAFAGTTLINYNGAAGNMTIALEAMATDQTVTFNGTGNTVDTIGIGYQTNQHLATGNLMVATLVGAKFPETAINVCGVGVAGGADGSIGNTTPSANSTEYVLAC